MSRKSSLADPKPSVTGRANESLLKQKIKDLEDEVTQLRRRLDELRKAKNTTILKREKEIVEMNAPNLGRRESTVDSSKLDDLQKQLKEEQLARKFEKENHDSALAKLMAKHKADLEELERKFAEMNKPKAVPLPVQCDHEPQIARLKRLLSDLEADKSALEVENEQLREKVESLLVQLSEKEARNCYNEEQIKVKLQEKWKEMYDEWMRKTEARIAELQEANNLLQTVVRRTRPPDEP